MMTVITRILLLVPRLIARLFGDSGDTLGEAGGSLVADARRALEGNEWSRFAHIEPRRAVAKHVLEDKLQIITFRDRNRFE